MGRRYLFMIALLSRMIDIRSEKRYADRQDSSVGIEECVGSITAQPRAAESQQAIPPPKETIGNLWQCPICSGVYKQSGYLVRHLETHSVYNNKCVFCGSAYNSPSAMAWHMCVHHKEEMFVKRSSGARHVGKNLLQYVCATCGNKYGSKQERAEHVREHTGEHPFSCPICNLRFKTSSSCMYHAGKCRRFPGVHDSRKRPDQV
ncbi:hypothetical protein CRM22_003546 [Opisthorchis felineus]|uniref:C2H2-type domain-containing protein n=1 Tax=Opisthorchis felineus TaxID=147828 RepID=A0A4S2M195_OPIFE|nr:hypothetical protein CRM22_003546 [Opisthorchis felineus]